MMRRRARAAQPLAPLTASPPNRRPAAPRSPDPPSMQQLCAHSPNLHFSNRYSHFDSPPQAAAPQPGSFGALAPPRSAPSALRCAKSPPRSPPPYVPRSLHRPPSNKRRATERPRRFLLLVMSRMPPTPMCNLGFTYPVTTSGAPCWRCGPCRSAVVFRERLHLLFCNRVFFQATWDDAPSDRSHVSKLPPSSGGVL